MVHESSRLRRGAGEIAKKCSGVAKLLRAKDTTLYRSVTMRVDYFPLDRPDV